MRREYDFEGGCLIGVFGHKDSNGIIKTLGYYYDPDVRPSNVALIVTIVILLCCVCSICYCF